MLRIRENILLWLSVIALLMFMNINAKITLGGDVPTETAVIQEIGDGFIVVAIKNGKGLKDGAKLTFHTHEKTKIVMAKSKTPLTLSSLLVGDYVQVTLGRNKIDKDSGKTIRYVDRIDVLSGKKRLRHHGKKFRSSRSQ